MKCKILIIVFLVFGFNAEAQFKKKSKSITIESSIQCGMCEDRLDNMFADFWAVKDAEYNLEEQTITVTYNPKKTNPEKIREAIANVGYDADDIAANKVAYESLPMCCQKGGHHPE